MLGSHSHFFDTLSVKAAGKCPAEELIDGHGEAQIDIHARHSLQHSFRHSLVFSRYTTVEGEGCARRLSAASQAELQEHETLHHSPSRLKCNWVILLCLLCFDREWTLSALARRALVRMARVWVSKGSVSVNTALRACTYVCSYVRARVVGVHACAHPCVCRRMSVCVCVRFSAGEQQYLPVCATIPGYRWISKKLLITPSILKIKANFFSVHKLRTKAFLFCCLNFLYVLYGISIISICR